MPVNAFIANYGVPRTLNELLIHWLDDETSDSCMRAIKETEYNNGNMQAYTAPRWALHGDVVFLMETVTSAQTLARLRGEYSRSKDSWASSDARAIEDALRAAASTYDRIGGKIYAVGRVSCMPFSLLSDSEEDEVAIHWGSTMYADFCDVFILEHPVPYTEFKQFIALSCQGSITPVFGDGFDALRSMITRYNSNVPKWFYAVEAGRGLPIHVNDENFLQRSGSNRARYMFEQQFRHYYVDHLLRWLGSQKRFWAECRCKNDGMADSFVDNVIRVRRMYLPVEVKLNIKVEPHLETQLDKYLRPDRVFLTDRRSVTPSNLLNPMLVIDTSAIYTYDGRSVAWLCDLAQFSTIEDIHVFREDTLYRLLRPADEELSGLNH